MQRWSKYGTTEDQKRKLADTVNLYYMMLKKILLIILKQTGREFFHNQQ